jgi:thiosulfate/3-mercaptopyruvate sulfurtransferase
MTAHVLPLVALLLPASADSKLAAYPRGELLVEAAELAKPAVRKDLLVLDARPRRDYLAGHVPGAVWVDTGAWAKAFQAGQDPAEWARRLGALGIDPKRKVVVYDAGKKVDGARVWWVLRYWGVGQARLLNGGWMAWSAAGGEVEKKENAPTPVETKLEARRGRRVTKADILGWLRDKNDSQILDTRSEGEYCGVKKEARRGGAVPGAAHLEWTQTLDPKTGKFKPPSELTRLFRDAGVDLSKPVTTYCQSGGRASVMAFALELIGGKDVRNYYNSWLEWGNDPDTPVVTPKAKK